MSLARLSRSSLSVALMVVLISGSLAVLFVNGVSAQSAVSARPPTATSLPMASSTNDTSPPVEPPTNGTSASGLPSYVLQHVSSVSSVVNGTKFSVSLGFPSPVEEGDAILVGGIFESTMDCQAYGIGCSYATFSDSLSNAWSCSGSMSCSEGSFGSPPYVDIEFASAVVSHPGRDVIHISSSSRIDLVEAFELSNFTVTNGYLGGHAAVNGSPGNYTVAKSHLDVTGGTGSWYTGNEFSLGGGNSNAAGNLALILGASDLNVSASCTVDYATNITLTLDPACGTVSGQGQVFGAYGTMTASTFQIALSSSPQSSAEYITSAILVDPPAPAVTSTKTMPSPPVQTPTVSAASGSRMLGFPFQVGLAALVASAVSAAYVLMRRSDQRRSLGSSR